MRIERWHTSHSSIVGKKKRALTNMVRSARGRSDSQSEHLNF